MFMSFLYLIVIMLHGADYFQKLFLAFCFVFLFASLNKKVI